MFEGFDTRRVATEGAEIFARTAGDGEPVLLLHGFPQTHVMWHRVAPVLAERLFVVAPDLRGYGDSRGPAPDAAHQNYSKRAMAADMVALMASLGHERFMLAGHDRGGRVGYRMALDAPERVSRFAAVDIIPTLDAWQRMNWQGALGTYHWSFLAQPAPMPEHLIGGDPEFYLQHLLARWAGDREALDAAAVAEYARHYRRPEVIQATCEDYRAGATVDIEHDRADRDAGRRLACPVLVLWGRRYLSAKAASPADVWRGWADDVREVALDCGHFLAEEQPEATAAALGEFFLS